MAGRNSEWEPYFGPIEQQAAENKARRVGRPSIYDRRMGTVALSTTDEHVKVLLHIAKLIGQEGNASAGYRWLVETATTGACWELLKHKAQAEMAANRKSEVKASDRGDDIWVPYESPEN